MEGDVGCWQGIPKQLRIWDVWGASTAFPNPAVPTWGLGKAHHCWKQQFQCHPAPCPPSSAPCTPDSCAPSVLRIIRP